MRKIHLLFLFFLLLHIQSQAQQLTITGTVKDAKSTPTLLPGVSILIEGTTQGTITDFEGNFTIKVPDANATLVFSFIGYKSQTITLSGKSQIEVFLEEETKNIDEVLVIGYGTKKKSDIIGSVSSVSGDEATKISSSSFVQSLQGRATGVQITTTSGVPGANVNVNIRGVHSINTSSDPLWIVDGMPIYSGGGLETSRGTTGQNPLSMINPNDIESISFLKDASATAIYGSRGSNGVIIITTKSGKKGGTLNIDYSTGVSSLTKTPHDVGYANSKEWFQIMDLAMENSSPGVVFQPSLVLNLRETFSKLSRDQAMLVQTDWFDQIIRTGKYQDVNLSSTKALDNANLFTSINYRDEQSVYKSNDFKRLTGRINLDFEPIKNLKTGFKLNVMYTKNDRIKTAGSGSPGNGGGGVGGFGVANRGGLPWFPIYDPNNPTGYWSPAAGANLLANIDRSLFKDAVEQFRSLGGISFDYRFPFLSGLSLRYEGSFDYIQNNSESWVSKYLTYDATSYAYSKAVNYLSYNNNLYTTFSKTFGSHWLNVVAGTESSRKSATTRDLSGKNLIGGFQELGTPATFLDMYSGLGSEEYMMSYFGRADYKFKDRYLIGMSIRADGSSKFASKYKWHPFTAYSLGWIASNEPFMQNIESISLLKLRGSYGQTGNSNVPGGLFVTGFSNDNGNRYGYLDLVPGGTRVTNIGNPFLTWETTSSYDAGIDFGLFKNKVSGSVAYYQQNVDGLILSYQLPPSTGTNDNNFWDNVGAIRNYGFEISINTINIDKRESSFRWTTDINFSSLDNRVVKLDPDAERTGAGLLSGNYISMKNERVRTWFIPEYAGVDPEKGVEMIYEVDYANYIKTYETVKTGRVIPATLDNMAKNRFIHTDKTPTPRFFGGINNTIEYKGFELSVIVSFSGGNYVYDYNRQRASFPHNGQTVLLREILDNHWENPGDVAEYPQPMWNSTYPGKDWDPTAKEGLGDWRTTSSGNYSPETRMYSRFLYKGDYIRVKNIQFGYNLPQAFTSKLKINGIRLYVSATNLFTFTDYPGFDPETNTGLIDAVPLPSLKTISFGASIKL